MRAGDYGMANVRRTCHALIFVLCLCLCLSAERAISTLKSVDDDWQQLQHVLETENESFLATYIAGTWRKTPAPAAWANDFALEHLSRDPQCAAYFSINSDTQETVLTLSATAFGTSAEPAANSQGQSQSLSPAQSGQAGQSRSQSHGASQTAQGHGRGASQSASQPSRKRDSQAAHGGEGADPPMFLMLQTAEMRDWYNQYGEAGVFLDSTHDVNK